MFSLYSFLADVPYQLCTVRVPAVVLTSNKISPMKACRYNSLLQ